MEKIHEIERLEGLGITAKVINTGKLYTTYRSFAYDAGYPLAYRPKGVPIGGKTVKVLAKGKHEDYDRIIYVIEDDTGAHYLIGEEGLRIEFPEKVARPAVTEILDAYERGYAKGKADALAEMRRVVGA